MNVRSAAGALSAAVAAGALVASAAQVQAARERLYPPAADRADTLYMRSGAALRPLTGAYTALAADIYWIRTIQYYGGTKRRLAAELARSVAPPPSLLVATPPDEFQLLFPLLDITTTLDPRFNIAYRFGAVFLAEPYPGGPGRPDLAIALLEKGLRQRSDKWEYMQDIGFVHYWYRHDFRAAADWFDRAARLPRAPWWLKSLAATTLAEGGDRQTSRVMWQAILESAEVDWLRVDAARRLAQLSALDQIDALQAAVDRFAAQSGSAPLNWGPVIRANRWAGIPVDPTGTVYELTPGGRVEMARRSRLWPLPEEPQKTVARRPPS